MCNKNRNEQNPLDFCKHNGNYIYLNMFLPFAFFGPDTLSFGHCPNYPSPMHAIEAAFSRRENFIFCVVLNWVKMIIWIVKNGFYGSCPETGLFMVSLTVRVTPTLADCPAVSFRFIKYGPETLAWNTGIQAKGWKMALFGHFSGTFHHFFRHSYAFPSSTYT